MRSCRAFSLGMEDVIQINRVLVWVFAALTLFGLYRPWLALWWLPVTNRKMVLQRYGLITLGLLLSYWLGFIIIHSKA